MTMLDKALALAKRDFWVFPLKPNGKLPAIKGWHKRATIKPAQIEKWWTKWPEANIGIATGPSNLVVIDVDVKGDKNGLDSLEELRLTHDIPETLTAQTATGGLHLIFKALEDTPIGNSAGKLGDGLDTRGLGGFIVAPGSVIDGNEYKFVKKRKRVALPADIGELLATVAGKPTGKYESVVELDTPEAIVRAAEIAAAAEPQYEGQRNNEGFKLAARLKDRGISYETCLDLMHGWNERGEPLDDDELATLTRSAYENAQNAPGSQHPAAEFEPVDDDDEKRESAIATLNKTYAHLAIGASHCVLEETTGPEGERVTLFRKPDTFHGMLANKKITLGDGKQMLRSKYWWSHHERRQYRGLCFLPRQDPEPGFYNLWRGFAYEPADCSIDEARKRCSLWLNHIHHNVCRGDEKMTHYVISWFAQMVQEPRRKPGVALVLRGGKGVGKGVAVEAVGKLLGSHYMLTNERRYITERFNAHLENLLFFVLDEAYWAGDKQAEGVLKGLITGTKLTVERKGLEAYTVDQCLRLALIGNEDWIAPASTDERRFAVLDVGERRKQDRGYFGELMAQLDEGGYEALLKFLLGWSTSIDVGVAPSSQALADQKLESLGPVEQWIYDSLHTGRLIGVADSWPRTVETETAWAAMDRYCRERRIGGWVPSRVAFGKRFRKVLPGARSTRFNGQAGERPRGYKLQDLERSRDEFCNFLGSEVQWDS